MTSLKRHIILLLAVLASMGVHGQTGETFNGLLYPTVTVQAVLDLALVRHNASAINVVTSADYQSGVQVPAYSSAQVKSNVPWMLSVSAATPYFSASGRDASTDMPSSVLRFTVDKDPAVYPLVPEGRVLKKGIQGHYTKPGNSFDLNLLVAPVYQYGPGIYTITLNYTLTAQ